MSCASIHPGFCWHAILVLLSFCAAGRHALAETPDLGEAQLPSGVSLNWTNATISTVSAKRSQLALSGLWRFSPVTEGAAEPPTTGWGYIKVPGSWQDSRGGSSIAARGRSPQWDQFDGARVARAWYERQVIIPAEWQGRAISLRCERVCTDAIVYVNGIECGKIAWPWGSVNITPAVTPGQTANLRILLAAIADSEQVGSFWQSALSSAVTFSTASLRSRGLTGNVFLKAAPPWRAWPMCSCALQPANGDCRRRGTHRPEPIWAGPLPRRHAQRKRRGGEKFHGRCDSRGQAKSDGVAFVAVGQSAVVGCSASRISTPSA